MTAIVTVSGVSFEFSNGRELFRNLNFTINQKRTALVGPNGIGKTCLARLIAGEIEPNEGRVQRAAPIVFFPQRVKPGAVTVEEHLLAAQYSWSFIGETLLEGIDRKALCTQLSGGQWMRVRLARLLDDQFIILDEPTNDLDRNGRQAVFEFLSNHTGGVLLISHDRECLALCDEVLELSNHGLSRYGGGWAFYEQAKAQERENLRSALEVAKRDRENAISERNRKIAKQEKRNRQGAKVGAKGGQAKILLGTRKRRAQATTAKVDTTTFERAQNAVRQAFEAYNQLKIDPVMFADLTGVEIPAQKLVAEAIGFNVRFRDWIYREDLNFCWRGNVRIALKGANGSGKTTLLKALIGEKFDARGELRTGELVTLYVNQGCSDLDDERTVFENVRSVSDLSDSEIRNGLAKFLFPGDTVFQRGDELSGGERLRLALARGFLAGERPELLVLDEPTNNLDLGNVEFLEVFIRGFSGAVVAVSHDEVFLKRCGVSVELAF